MIYTVFSVYVHAERHMSIEELEPMVAAGNLPYCIEYESSVIIWNVQSTNFFSYNIDNKHEILYGF